eukprot:360078-Chlamydomonas_euryale.AAC.1
MRGRTATACELPPSSRPASVRPTAGTFCLCKGETFHEAGSSGHQRQGVRELLRRGHMWWCGRGNGGAAGSRDGAQHEEQRACMIRILSLLSRPGVLACMRYSCEGTCMAVVVAWMQTPWQHMRRVSQSMVHVNSS